MGSTDSIPETSCLRLNKNNWRVMTGQGLQQQPIQYGRYVRLKNQMTAQEINQYQLVFSDYDDYQQFVHVLNFRNSMDELVHIRYFNEEKIQHLCSLLVNLHVYIDHFPLRISQIQHIPYPENLYVLVRALTGFSILYRQFGHFHITEDLICINEQGIIKIWFNPNLSKPHFQLPRTASNQQNISNHVCSYEIQHKNSQNSMVWSILTIVQRLTNKLSLPNGVSFVNYLQRINKSQLNFDQALQYLFLYAHENQCQIPEMFESALKIIRQRKGIFDSEVDITLAKVKVQEIDLANLGSRFKESKVQRIESVKNPSLKSFIASQSNHTFADKLKTFDRAKARMEMQMLGKPNLTPIKQNIVSIPEKKQPLTERVLGNPMNFSYVSSPQFQSLTAIGQKNNPGAFPTSSSNSQIISKNPLTLSQSPAKDKPLTYFSQYINPAEQVKMVKKGTLFSFGQGHGEQKPRQNLLTQVPITISLQNSKNQVKPINKPIVTFTYNTKFGRKSSTLTIPEPQPKINILPLSARVLQKSQGLDQMEMEMPISPPSVDKRSSTFLEQAKQVQKNQRQAQYKRDENMIETMMRRQNKEICESFYTKAAENRQDFLDKIKQEIHEEQGPLDFGVKIEQSRDRLSNQIMEQSKQPFSPSVGQEELPMILESLGNQDKGVQTEDEKPIILQSSISNPEMGKGQQVITTILFNEFDIDPDIMSDLLQYQQSKVRKKKSKNCNNL